MTAATLIAEARLTGSRSQQIYDLLLRSLSFPGRVIALPSWCPSHVPPSAWPALALAGVDVRIAADEPTTAALIADATGAPIGGVDDAWVLSLERVENDRLDRIPVGSALEPERGARVGIAVADFSAGGTVVTVSGPGVDGRADFTVGGIDPAILSRLGRATAPFPAGFDAWLISPTSIVGIPRTTSIEIDRGAS